MRQLCERSVALTNGQGILDNTDGSQEPYDGITRMIQIALANAADMDLEKSPLVKAGVKLKHPEPYPRGSCWVHTRPSTKIQLNMFNHLCFILFLSQIGLL
jgi:hypothetical protein